MLLMKEMYDKNNKPSLLVAEDGAIAPLANRRSLGKCSQRECAVVGCRSLAPEEGGNRRGMAG